MLVEVSMAFNRLTCHGTSNIPAQLPFSSESEVSGAGVDQFLPEICQGMGEPICDKIRFW